MSVGRHWVRRLGLLLAAGMVVQVPGLVGVGMSGASAAPTPSYSVNLSIDSNCEATVKVTWSGAKVNSVSFAVTDLSETSAPYNSPSEPVSSNANHGTVSYPVPLNKKLVGTDSFNAEASFYSANPTQTAFANPVKAPCYLGTLGVAP